MKWAVAGCAARWSSSRSTSAGAAARGDGEPEHLLAALVVLACAEHVAAGGAQVVDAVAGEAARGVDHVRLRVAGVDADRVQLQELAAVVLVDPADRAAALRARRRVQVVVEVVEHRRVQRHGAEQLAEAAQHVRPHRVALVGRDREAVEAVAHEHVEVVEPEVDQQLLQLVAGVDRAHHLGGGELVEDEAERPAVGVVEREHLRGRVAERGIGREPRVELGVRARGELLLDPVRQALVEHGRDLAGARAVPGPVQEVLGDAGTERLGRCQGGLLTAWTASMTRELSPRKRAGARPARRPAAAC